MKTVQNRLKGVLSVTRTVELLSVKVLYGRETGEKSIISDHTVEVVWRGCQLVSLVAQRTGVANLSVLRHLF